MLSSYEKLQATDTAFINQCDLIRIRVLIPSSSYNIILTNVWFSLNANQMQLKKKKITISCFSNKNKKLYEYYLLKGKKYKVEKTSKILKFPHKNKF